MGISAHGKSNAKIDAILTESTEVTAEKVAEKPGKTDAPANNVGTNPLCPPADAHSDERNHETDEVLPDKTIVAN